MPPTTVTVRPTWSVLCWNLTSINQSVVLHGANAWPPVSSRSNNATDLDDSAGLDDRDKHALLYIVVVLLFYSTGIVIAIVTYLKREKAEIVEEKAYEDYTRSAAVAAPVDSIVDIAVTASCRQNICQNFATGPAKFKT